MRHFKIALTFFMFILNQLGYGQSANPTIYTSPVGIGPTSISARQSGNDVIGSGMGIFRVFVNDADSNLYWANNTSTFYSGAAPFAPTYVNDPDVAVVTLNDTAYAVVVYHHVGVGFFTTIFKWSGTAFVKVHNTSLLLGTFPNDCAINVDGDNYSNYAITWGDASGDIWYATGDALNNITYRTQLNTSTNYIWPDVALYNDGTSNVATFSYVDAPTDIIVEQHSYANLVIGTISPISPTPLTLSAPPLESFEMYPRVACPPPAGSSSDWTVVAQSADKPTYSRILGWTRNSGTTYPYDYTNPTGSPWNDMTVVNNYFPVVTYDNFYPSGSNPIWVGWTTANSGGGASGFDLADYVVMIPCDPIGAPYSGVYELQTGQISGDYSEALSVAGCHNCDIMMTYWENYKLNGSWVQQAEYLEITNPTICTSSFRSSAPFGTQLLDNQIIARIYSIQGVLINESIIGKEEINQYLNGYSNLNGIYIFTTTDSTGNSKARKIIFKP